MDNCNGLKNIYSTPSSLFLPSKDLCVSYLISMVSRFRQLRKSDLAKGGETEINSGLRLFPDRLHNTRLLFSGSKKQNWGQGLPLRICIDGNDRDYETAFPKKYGKMACKADQLPHLITTKPL